MTGAACSTTPSGPSARTVATDPEGPALEVDGAAASDAPTTAAAVGPAPAAAGLPTRASAAEARAARGSRAALAACLLAGFATLFDSAAITFVAPTVSAVLGGGTAGVQWLLASFSLTFGLGLTPAGRLGDAYGRRALFVVGMGLFVAGGLGSVLAPDIIVLIAARLAQGLGAGVISAQVLGAVQDLFRGADRLRALSLYTGAGALAALLGPLGAGLVLGSLGPELSWRIVLLLPVPFGVAAIVMGLRGLPSARTAARPDGGPAARRAERLSLDLPAVALLAAVVLLLTLPVVQTGSGGPALAAALAAALVAAGVLVLWERAYARRGRLPLFARELVRSRGFLAGNAVALLWFGANLSVTSVVTIHLLQLSALTPLWVAVLLAPAALARLCSSLLSGRVFAAWGPQALLGGLLLQTILLAVLALLSPQLGVTTLAIAAGLVQVGLGLCSGIVEPPLRVVTLSFATGRTHGVAASFLQLTQRLSATYMVALTTGILLGTTGAATGTGLGAALGVCATASGLALLVGLHPTVRRWGR